MSVKITKFGRFTEKKKKTADTDRPRLQSSIRPFSKEKKISEEKRSSPSPLKTKPLKKKKQQPKNRQVRSRRG